MQALAAWGGADINAVVPPVWRRDLGDQHGADILDIDPAILVGCQGLKVVVAGKLQGVVKDRVLADRHTLRSEGGNDLLPGDIAGADPDRGGPLLLERSTDFLRCLKAELRHPLHENPLGHGVADGEVLDLVLLRGRVAYFLPSPDGGPKHPVHKALEVVETALLSNLHRLVDHRGIGDIGQKVELID